MIFILTESDLSIFAFYVNVFHVLRNLGLSQTAKILLSSRGVVISMSRLQRNSDVFPCATRRDPVAHSPAAENWTPRPHAERAGLS